MLQDKAVQHKAETMNMLKETAPVAMKIFSVKPLNRVVDALNKVLPLFGVTDKYPSFTEDVKQLPSEFVQQLLMLSEAQSDYFDDSEDDIDQPLINLATIRSDTDLLLLASILIALAKDPDFKSFLLKPLPEQEIAVPEEEEEDLDTMLEALS